MTLTELKSLIDSNYPDNTTGLIKPSNERLVLKSIADFITSNQGEVEQSPFVFDPAFSYGIDTPVVYQNKWYLSLEAANLGNTPDANPTKWAPINSYSDIIKVWEAGVYVGNVVLVINDNVLYKLDRTVAGTDPYVSADFAVEKHNGIWVPMAPLKYIIEDINDLSTFHRGTTTIIYCSDPIRGKNFFRYVTEADFVGSPNFGVSFPALDGGYWVRMFKGDEVFCEWWKDSGDADDTASIQKAIDYASTSGIKNVSGKLKNYTQSSIINIKDNVNIDFKGGKITINVKNINQFSAVGVDNWRVTNTEIIGNNFKDELVGNVGNIIIVNGCDNWKISNNTFRNHSKAGIEVVDTNKSSNFSIKDNDFFDGYMPTPKNDFTGFGYYDINIDGSSTNKHDNFEITGNKCYSLNDSGISLVGGNEKFIVSNNISENHVRHGILSYANNSGRGVISNNYCENNGWTGIYVNDQIGNGGNELGKTTISANNCYGNGYSDALASDEIFDVFRCGISIYSAGDVTISDNIVGGNVNSAVGVNAHGIVINLANKVTINDNIIYDNDGYGVRFTSGAQGGYAIHNTCSGNLISGCGLDGISIRGISKASRSGRYNLLSKNIVLSCDNKGISVDGGGYVNVEGNICNLNGQDGINFVNSKNINFTNNICLNNGQENISGVFDGIKVTVSDGIYFNGNFCGNDDDLGTKSQRVGITTSTATLLKIGINSFSNLRSNDYFISASDTIKYTQQYSGFEVLADGATSLNAKYERYITNNTTSTGLTSINSAIEDGKTIIVKFGDNNTFVRFDDGVNLDGNKGQRWNPKENDFMICTIHDGRWDCILSVPPVSSSHTEFEPITDGATSISSTKFNRFITANTTATTIQSINSTFPDGATVILKINDANTTIKFTGLSGNLVGNNGVDWNPSVGDVLIATFDATNTEWNCLISSSNITTSGATGSRPTTTSIGFRYFDTTLGKPIWYDGTNWVDATGTTV